LFVIGVRKNPFIEVTPKWAPAPKPAPSGRICSGQRVAERVDAIVVWRLDRWGWSLLDLIGTLQELHAAALECQ
jgi:hypothetical protein